MNSRGRETAGLTAERLVDWNELRDIELVVLRQMKEYAAGSHQSVFQGEGFNLVGLRDWEPGDRPSDIDWGQSTLTNFSPLVSRQHEQESVASIMIVADTSLSTQCGTNGVSIANVIGRTLATLGLAGAFCQDQVGLVTLDRSVTRLEVRPGVGKNHVYHCLETYQSKVFEDVEQISGSEGGLTEILRRQSFLPVISDFLFEDSTVFLEELALLAPIHDVLLVMVDSKFAYQLPDASSGWLETYDVETGQTRLFSARDLNDLDQEVGQWQLRTIHEAERLGLDIVKITKGQEHQALLQYLNERRLRRR